MKDKVISLNTTNSEQSIYYEEVIKTSNDIKLRVKIRSNFYKFQCSARVDVWSNNQWNECCSILPDHMKTPVGLSYNISQAGREKHFLADRNQLVKLAKEILK